NFPYSAPEDDVTGLFAAHGPVERVKIITDRETGRSKGFAFVTLGDQSQLNAAIEALNGYDFQGRALRVNASEPKEFKPRSNSGGGYGGDRRGGGGYGGDRRGGGGYGGGDRRGGGGFKGGGHRGGNRGGYGDSNNDW
ncbi:MAG: RNA recognition motif domain-containing protein, partial [Luteolibacter sp.]